MMKSMDEAVQIFSLPIMEMTLCMVTKEMTPLMVEVERIL